MTNPTSEAARRAAVYGLAREIGAQVWSPPDDLTFMAAWCRELAATVAQHAVLNTYRYGQQVMTWAEEIIDAPNDKIIETCASIHNEILAIDYDDGWPTDRAGSALNAVCLGMTHALSDRSRWPAEASQRVWSFATGCHAYNEVVKVSRAAWQQHVFTQVAAIASRQADELDKDKVKE